MGVAFASPVKANLVPQLCVTPAKPDKESYGTDCMISLQLAGLSHHSFSTSPRFFEKETGLSIKARFFLLMPN